MAGRSSCQGRIWTAAAAKSATAGSTWPMPPPATAHPRLYAVVGPEPQGPDELDLPDREQPDGYLQLAQALSRAGGQTLAIDTPRSPDLQRLTTAELRAERHPLRRQLDQAPRDRSRELTRAAGHRQHAEEALTAHQSTGRPPG